MSTELIVHFSTEHADSDLEKTLLSLKTNNISPDSIRLCLNPPRYISYTNFVDQVNKYTSSTVYVQILTSLTKLNDVVNASAEASSSDHYVFVNAGYEFENNNIFEEIKNNTVLFSDGIDDQLNEFSCKTKLHKYVGGFGQYTIAEKVEHLLKVLGEAKKNAGTTDKST